MKSARRRWVIIVGLVGVVAVAGSLYAQQKKAGKLTTDDYVEIYRLYGRYPWAVDSRDGETWAGLFTPDGMFEHPDGKQIVGHDELVKEPLRGLGPASATTAVHAGTNIWVEPTAEGARGGAYLLNIVPGEKGKPATITAVAFYEDTFVKTRDGWRIKRRKAHNEGGLAPTIITQAGM